MKILDLKIQVIGLGYVGLPTFLIFRKAGFNVIGVDNNLSRLNGLLTNNISLEDKILDNMMKDIGADEVSVSPLRADYHFIAVPTPFVVESKKVDLTYIRQVIEKLISLEQDILKIVIESTITPGTIDLLKREYDKPDRKIHFFHAPERILPGNTHHELIFNDRVIGSEDPNAAVEIVNIYKSFSQGEITVTDVRTAELSKVVENAYRDVNIAFANEIAQISYENGIDVTKLIEIANRHPRVNILKPGPGVGGHCIPIDPWFLVGEFPCLTNLIASARKTNDLMPSYIAKRILNITNQNNISHSKVGIYGLTYKANIADFRESPSFEVINQFNLLTGTILVSYDPFTENGIEENAFDRFVDSIELLVILVAHNQIISKSDELLLKFEGKFIFDVVNAFNQESLLRL